jgi:hypothetical protein
MTINYEVKGNLARLLATEDLVVEHKKVSTACFNIHTRVLTLPIWERASATVYDLLVGHEVGHALYTPIEDWKQIQDVPKSYVNITEDARIEKLMKRRYNGLNRIFYTGYKELYDIDFFCLGEDFDITTFNLADRVNLHFKIGNFLIIEFNEEEQQILDLIEKSETFEDALNAARLMYKYCKEELKNLNSINEHVENYEIISDGEASSEISESTSEFTPESSEQESSQGSSTDGSSPEPETTETPSDGEAKNELDELNSESTESQSKSNLGGDKTDSEPTVRTDKSFEESIKKLINGTSEETVYVEFPKLNLKNIIIESDIFHSRLLKYWKDVDSDTSIPDGKYLKYKQDAQNQVNYMMKEFECKKTADSYARAKTSRILDCSKLHTYKYNEDLFKKVTTLSDGKNHGLIFVLDWSGSMDGCIFDTVKQMFNIVLFCKKASIPFEVYAFSNEYYEVENDKKIILKRSYEIAEYLLSVPSDFKMIKILTSESRVNILDSYMKNIFRIAYYYNDRGYASYTIPAFASLSGTPLNEAMISLGQIIPEFRKKTKVQKLHCIILTDGDAAGIPYHKMIKTSNGEDCYMGYRSLRPGVCLRNRSTGKTYNLDSGHYQINSKILECVKEANPEVNFIGIRLVESGEFNYFINRYPMDDDKIKSLKDDWKKNKSISLTNCGYTKYFGISLSSLNQDSSLKVKPNESVLTAFKRSVNLNKMNKKFLNEFVSLIS